MDQRGCVHIYCGEGKGKTEICVGLAIRAAGAGLKVLFNQFLKNGDSSECVILSQIPNLTLWVERPVHKFWQRMNLEEQQQTQRFYSARLADIRQQMMADVYDVIILDELIGAVCAGVISENEVIQLIDARPQGVELLMSGRYPTSSLLERAHYVSQLEAVKHPFKDEQLPARKGIEY